MYINVGAHIDDGLNCDLRTVLLGTPSPFQTYTWVYTIRTKKLVKHNKQKFTFMIVKTVVKAF